MTEYVDLDRVVQLAKSREALVAAGTLLCLLTCGKLNSWMSRRVVNNYTKDRTWDWSKEVVLLTGGSQGIGARVASMLAEKKVKVVIVDLNPPKGSLPPNQFFYKLDIASSADISAVAQQIRSEHGDPTVLINNAGIGNALPILKLPEPKLRKLFDVNIIAHFLLLQEFLPSMVRANHGHIVTLASMASFSTQATNVDYACTKAGALVLHEGIAQELRFVYNAPNVRMTVVHPSWVRTPMIQKLIDSKKFTDGVVEADDVAGAIVQQLYSGYGGQIIIPRSLWWVSAVRGFPSWLQEKFRDTVTTSLLKAEL